jgi:predicted SnoaL-like aldol condensation-catalyzing enzyme
MGTPLENAKSLYSIGIRDGEPRRAMAEYTGTRYTQHSTGVKDGQEGFVEFFDTFVERNPDREIEILRGLEDGDLVFMHSAQRLNGGASRWITMDILQADEQGRMIEHWDVIAEWVDEPQIDGPTDPTDPTDLEQAADNKALVERYIGDVLTEGRSGRLAEYVSPDLIQHDPAIADGIEALAASHASTVYRETYLVVGDGDMVATLSRVDIDGTETAVMDLFRVADGRIVEQWNAREPVPPADELVNSGKF